MAYTFVANADELNAIHDRLEDYRVQLGECIDNIFAITGKSAGEPGSLKEAWSGTSYDTFAESCGRYYPFLQEMLAIIDDFLANTTKLAEEASGLADDINAACKSVNEG